MEELYNMSGVDQYVPKPMTLTIDSTSFPKYDGEFHSAFGHSDEDRAGYRAKFASLDRHLTASGRD